MKSEPLEEEALEYDVVVRMPVEERSVRAKLKGVERASSRIVSGRIHNGGDRCRKLRFLPNRIVRIVKRLKLL